MKIADFGMARLINHNDDVRQDDQNLTLIVVSYPYRAPEVILLEPYTPAVDVWSIGCIFAEMLATRRKELFCHEVLFYGKG